MKLFDRLLLASICFLSLVALGLLLWPVSLDILQFSLALFLLLLFAARVYYGFTRHRLIRELGKIVFYAGLFYLFLLIKAPDLTNLLNCIIFLVVGQLLLSYAFRLDQLIFGSNK